ncbi:hypothetical protein [Pseudonocardia sp. GCM10023141]|uniref:hypothetical protein n=1 Tax=Pseudonocardia sp. GCM10023141 TaxID=3252653 RepID=UPI00360B598F
MASLDELRIPGLDALRAAIPLPRDPVEHRRIAADDDLIESLRRGDEPGDDDDPLMRMLAAWRTDTLDGT